MIKGIKLTEKEFNSSVLKIDEKLTKLKEFTSPTYQSKGIPTKDGLVILLKPKQQVFIDALKPLNIKWADIKESELKIEEI